MRTLYFDIDGVLLSYEDVQRPLLSAGALEKRLKTLGFGRLVCVSGWSDIVNADVLGNSRRSQELAIHRMLESIFPDQTWFLSRLTLAHDTDHRCQHIDLTDDWFYMDDWADKFFPAQFGAASYRHHLGRRILLVNPHSDGGDILQWLDTPVTALCAQK